MESYSATFSVQTQFSCRAEEYPTASMRSKECIMRFIYQEQLEILECLCQKAYAGDMDGVLELLGELGDSMR